MERLKRDQPIQKQKQVEPISAKSQEIDNTQVKFDIDKASEEMERLLVVDDEPSLEPIDTTESDAYIRSFFKKKDTQ